MGVISLTPIPNVPFIKDFKNNLFKIVIATDVGHVREEVADRVAYIINSSDGLACLHTDIIFAVTH